MVNSKITLAPAGIIRMENSRKAPKIKKEPTVILGTGTGIAGRIVMTSSVSPAENLVFYGNSTQGSGWQLVSSTVAEEIVLVYTKEGRHATIEILRRTDYGNTLAGVAGFGRLFGSPNNSQITISVVHPGAIQQQNPYMSLKPVSASDSFVVQGD